MWPAFWLPFKKVLKGHSLSGLSVTHFLPRRLPLQTWGVRSGSIMSWPSSAHRNWSGAWKIKSWRPARFRKWRSHKNPKILRSWTCHKVIHLIPEPFLGMVGPCRRYHMFTKHLHIFHLLSGQIGQVSDKPAGWGRGAALSGMNVLPTADLWWCFVVHFVAYEADFIHADSWVNKWKLISRGSFDSWYKLQAARKPGLYLVIKL